MLIALNAATRGVCVISHAIVFGAPAVIATAGFAIVFALTTDRIKEKQFCKDTICWKVLNISIIKNFYYYYFFVYI